MAQLKRTANAVWHGTGKDGDGTLTTQSATLSNVPYSYIARFGDGKGTNPEELIAAAHAGCFSMALAFMLSGAGFTPEEIKSDAVLTMEGEGGGWRISAVKLTVRAKIPGIEPGKFQDLAAEAKANCPVSRVLNAEITLDAALA
ncbi:MULTISPECIES: OsmC family protein [Nitrospirillum]|uniref:Osmotically inducible protein OsmC n=1 Tax=Nitrospirillum amazonense TaxID=28077 RepID=A0A560G1J3_9PROT|nr:OsmC family protein [Nitrospirillum amazonense]MEC4589428.1 OsmC family protein [Nitrospirillum amazonense]TWB27766.1 osmotically inducible protein OsmC [Nitrospirillum amazonense]